MFLILNNTLSLCFWHWLLYFEINFLIYFQHILPHLSCLHATLNTPFQLHISLEISSLPHQCLLWSRNNIPICLVYWGEVGREWRNVEDEVMREEDQKQTVVLERKKWAEHVRVAIVGCPCHLGMALCLSVRTLVQGLWAVLLSRFWLLYHKNDIFKCQCT
jgi:hypothetical protein